MDFFSFHFFLFLLGGSIAYYLCPAPLRVKTVLPILNVYFILTFVHDPRQLIPLAVFLLLGFGGIRAVKTFPRKGLFLTLLCLVLAVFIYLKKYAFISHFRLIDWPYTVIGMSYVLFRIIQVLVDVYEGAIKEEVSLVSYLNFTCNFFTFVSGPIQRYQDYKAQEIQATAKTPDQQESFDRLSKLFNGYVDGYIRIFVLSAICLSLHNTYLSWLKDSFDHGSWLMVSRRYIPVAFLYTLYLYFNFSGYMSIVLSLGGSFGFKLPENFNKPFESKSFLELWSRWHITLSDWFKTYIFNPLIKFFAYRWPNPKIIAYQGVAAFFITFMLMGFWHGTTYEFLIYGLFLGSGVAINKLFDVQMRKNFKTSYKKMEGHKLAGLIGSALTYAYFSVGLTCMWFDYNDLVLLMTKIKLLGFLFILIGGTLFCAVVLWAVKHVGSWWIKISNHYYGALLIQSFRLFIILASWKGLHDAPEFIYKGF